MNQEVTKEHIMKGKQAHEKLLIIISNQENGNHNHSEIPLHTYQNVKNEEWLTTPSAGDEVGHRDSYITGGGGETQNGTTTCENCW